MRYITVEGLSFQYDAEPVLDNIHYHLDSGEFVTLTGENGAAKSTLIKATLGILKPKKGTVTISETNKDGKKLRMAYLPQQIASFNAGFPSTVYEFVKSGRYPRKGWFRRLTKHDLEHVQRALESVGMWENRHKQIGRLSGGQKQRLAIARALARKPEILIFDDSFSALDYKTDRKLRQELAEKTQDMTKLIVAQRISTIMDADQILVLDQGKVVGQGTHKELLANNEVYQEIAYSQLSKEELENGK